MTIKKVYDFIATQPYHYEAVCLEDIYKRFNLISFDERLKLCKMVSKLYNKGLIHRLFIEGKYYFFTFERKNIDNNLNIL